MVGFTLPSVQLPPMVHPSQLGYEKHHGSKLEYDDLSIDFIVDELLKNWKEIYAAMYNNAPADEYTTKKDLEEFDATVIVYSSHNNKIATVRFFNCVLTGLGQIQFQTDTQETDVLRSNLTLQYSYYLVE